MARFVDRRSAVTLELREIDALILLADETDDLDVRGHLSRLAVIRLSGYIESSVKGMINGFLEEHSSHRVLRFSQTQVGKLPNLNPAKLEAVVGSFDPDWRDELTAYLATDERRQLLGNLIGARHNLAHGGSTAVSTAKVHEYHSVAEGVVKFLMDRFLPLPTS